MERLQLLQHEVASAALTGIPAKEIDERVIDPSPLTDEEKAALRLFAWSFVSRFELRRMALDELRRLQEKCLGTAAFGQADRRGRATG